MTFGLRKLNGIIMSDVKSGNVEMFLNKPTSYFTISSMRIIGRGLFSFLFISIIGTIVMAIFVGLPNLNLPLFIPSLIITLTLGIILSIFIYGLIGLLAFFIQDVRPIYWIVDKFVMVLGGSYLPISMFPNFMKIIAFASPFGAINFATSTVYDSWNNEFILRIALQLIWIIIFGLLLKYVYKKVKEKAMINGG